MVWKHPSEIVVSVFTSQFTDTYMFFINLPYIPVI